MQKAIKLNVVWGGSNVTPNPLTSTCTINTTEQYGQTWDQPRTFFKATNVWDFFLTLKTKFKGIVQILTWSCSSVHQQWLFSQIREQISLLGLKKVVVSSFWGHRDKKQPTMRAKDRSIFTMNSLPSLLSLDLYGLFDALARRALFCRLIFEGDGKLHLACLFL